ncbi:hypothetical protein MASR1M66_10680 [Aminivibrio sp.]
MAKAKLASVWLEARAGCHTPFLDIDERIVGLLEKVELTSTPITDIKVIPEWTWESLREPRQRRGASYREGTPGKMQDPHRLGDCASSAASTAWQLHAR